MHDEINDIQSEVDGLNRLLGESLSAASWTPADPKSRLRQRLGILILKMLDGVLERRYMLRLEKWLLVDADARRYYVEFMHLEALLHMHYHPERFKLSCLNGSSK